MINKILRIFESNDFDFRKFANPEDELAHLFPSWVPYYRMKAAIAQAIQPSTILEIGVRYGYSGAAFLHGAPNGHYTGIDADLTSFGGAEGAINWAKKILPEKQSSFIVADSQTLKRFPGGIYDLIHIDGQQDGDGTYHDLEKALRQGRFVLVDGYHWSRENFQATNEFLRQNRQDVAYALTINTYAGELLLKVEDHALRENPQPIEIQSADIRNSYDSEYYLTNCGGWESFAQNQGRTLIDDRLSAMLDLALIGNPRKVLDLGCGRGEITRQLASLGSHVIALDYSADAIRIAQESLAGDSNLQNRVEFRCADATQFDLKEPVDKVIAGDIVEHLSEPELDNMYGCVAQHLAPAGQFVVHTAPSTWFYDFDYERRRKWAAKNGFYLPPNPRTHFEKIMHINEQSPPRLLRQLKKHFPHVVLWLATPQDPGGSLIKKMGHHELTAQRDIFAVASMTPIDLEEIKSIFVIEPISEEAVAKVGLSLQESETGRMHTPGQKSSLGVKLANNSSHLLGSQIPYPVKFAYRWIDAVSGDIVIEEGNRSRVTPLSAPGSTQIYHPEYEAPSRTGEYLLKMTLVQEGVRWFDWTNSQAVVKIPVTVAAAGNPTE